MSKCECYNEERYFSGFNTNEHGAPIPEYKIKTVCYGTKEREVCSCGGDQTKCNFYPDIRENANTKIRREAIINSIKNWPDWKREAALYDTPAYKKMLEENESLKAKLEVSERENKFYRWYISHQDLLWDAMNEYKKWNDKGEI